MVRKFIPIHCNRSTSFSLENRSLMGLYGLNETREYIDDGSLFLKVCDTSHWKNYDFTQEPLNLNQGEVILRNDNRYTEEGISPFLEWLHRYPPSTKPDFVLSQGNLMIFMCTPYEESVPWCYSIVNYNDTMYLKSNDTPYYVNHRENMSSFQLKSRKWGEKFHDILSRPPNSDYDNILWTNKSCEGMFSSSLDGIKLIYGATVKAIKDSLNEPLKCEDIIDFKETQSLRTHRQIQYFSKRRLMKWWCQNYLTGVSETLCGFSNNAGFVNEIKSFKVADIPSMRGVHWKPNVCLGFLRNLLYSLKEELTDEPNVVFNVSWDPPGSTINIERSDKDISYVVEDKYRV
uniref:Decapping nuclease n=1 Tax=Lepeophtheirus salmonis TaxID=72036 RepID=A0A0K2SV70_LEPSM